MTKTEPQPQRPDLTRGISVDEIAEGGKLVGQVGEDEVLVARIDGKFFAVGAKCTHYRGLSGKG